jgi:hypothetical protein
VYATDGDHQTVKNLRHNVLNNKVHSRVQVVKWDWTVCLLAELQAAKIFADSP